MSALRIIPLVLLAACGEPPLPAAAPDEALVALALDAARPEPFVEVVEDPRQFVPMDSDCPLVTEVALDPASDLPATHHQTWLGGCVLADGTTIDGSLELFDGPDGAWLAGEGFAVRHDGLTDFQLDGAIELQAQADLLLVDAAATWCGGPGPSCADGATTVDLSYTLFPFADYPSSYDVTANGAVGSGDTVLLVEGTWSIDDTTCADEPASGIFSLWSGERHAIVLDGATNCDGCATWMVQGIEAPPYCGVDL